MTKSKSLLLLAMLLTITQFALGGLIYQDSFDGTNADSWNITKGKWDYSSDGISNSKSGENRIFTDIDISSDSYTIEFTGNLLTGKGWGLYFGSELADNTNKVSGMAFQYDPGAGNAFVLRKWDNDKESTLKWVRSDLDYNTDHTFSLTISSTGFSALQDGVEVMNYTGNMNLVGSSIGLRTWSSSEAQFKFLSISDMSPGSKTAVPEPATFALVAAGSLVILRKRNKTC